MIDNDDDDERKIQKNLLTITEIIDMFDDQIYLKYKNMIILLLVEIIKK